jgi:hypothetical protein
MAKVQLPARAKFSSCTQCPDWLWSSKPPVKWVPGALSQEVKQLGHDVVLYIYIYCYMCIGLLVFIYEIQDKFIASQQYPSTYSLFQAKPINKLSYGNHILLEAINKYTN